MQLPAIPGWRLLVVLVVGGHSPFLADSPGGSSPPFLAGICCWWLWVVPCQSWLGALGAVSAISGWGLLVAVVLLSVWAWRASCSMCVCGVRRVFSCFVVCGVLLLVPFVVPWVCVSVWVAWTALAVGSGCNSLPFLAGVCCWCLRAFSRHSWLGVVSALPGHSWLGSAAGFGGWFLTNPG